MSKIDDKHAALLRQGFDLGPALGLEEDAGYGGRVRRYQNGNIYYHPVMGDSAREVHGGILATYVAHGGPGPHPATVQRHLGFPLSDETSAGDGGRLSTFEWGEIYWVPGRGGVVVHGAIQKFIGNYLSRFGRRLGLPLTDNMPIAGSEAVYFERGCIYFNTTLPGDFLVSHINPPLLGRPAILDSDSPGSRRFPNLITYPTVSNELYNAIQSTRPALFSELWDRRLSLGPVVAPGAWRDPLLLTSRGCGASISRPPNRLSASISKILAPAQLSHRHLYDLNLSLANNAVFSVSPHCYYAARDWTNFGIFHITDLHLSSRNENYRARLNALNLQEAGLQYANFQDNFRAFVTYANLLHQKGLADLVLATGDLVDYVFEADGSDNLRYSSAWSAAGSALRSFAFRSIPSSATMTAASIRTSFSSKWNS
jgi:LGFP repeat